MRVGSPLPGRIFREAAGGFGLSLTDPSEPLGTADRCRQALEEAGFDRIRVIPGRVDFEALDPGLAWEANFRSAGHDAARALRADQQAALRAQFMEKLRQAGHLDPAASARADVFYAVGRRPGSSPYSRE